MKICKRTWKIEVCPVCQRQNIGGHKNCYGGADRHDKTRWESVEVIPASSVSALEGRIKELEEATRFALATLSSDHRKGQPCGEDACWLCAGQTTLSEVLSASPLQTPEAS